MNITQAKEILKHQFGYDSFRLHQQAAIEAVLGGKDVVVLMPTGGGKSLCYQVPALMTDGLTLVISPLIALMKDQVDALCSNGVAAGFLNSTQSAAEQVEVFRAVRSGRLKILYVAPERLLQSGHQAVAFRDRRGSLCFELGPRFSARVPPPCEVETRVPGRSADRSNGHRR
jgi:ATP-dependent DNA helicase RecQ